MADLKTNFNLRFPNREESKIHLVCRWANQRLIFPTDITIKVKDWDSKSQRPNRKSITYTETRTRLENIESEAFNQFRQLINDSELNYVPSVEDLSIRLKEKLKGIKVSDYRDIDLFQFIDQFIAKRVDSLNPKTSKPYTKETIKSYANTKRKLEEYVQHKRVRRFGFDSIDLAFHRDFIKYMKSKNYSTNYIGNQIKNIKLFMSDSREDGFHTNLEYLKRAFTKPTEITDKIYLSVEDLEQIEKCDLSGAKRLDNVRDWLILGCWTGLRFTDLMNLKRENIFLDTPDGDYLEVLTSKTARTVIIPILPQAKRILNKYTSTSKTSLPRPLSNQKFNEFVKEVGQKSNIDETVTLSITKGGKGVSTSTPKYEVISSHICRRSFATNTYKMGVPTVTIREITGHKTEVAFLRYIRATSKEHANKLREIMLQRLSPLKVVG